MPRWLCWVCLGLGAVLALAGGLVGFLHSGPGERWLSGKLEENIAGLELDGYRLNWPFRMRADSLRLKDGQGVWLEISEPLLKWKPHRLLRKVVDINRLAARRVDVLRLPQDGGEAGGGEVSLPDITLRLHDLTAPVVLAAPVLGERLELDVGGSFVMQDGGGNVDIHVRDADGSLVRLAGTAGRDYLDLRWYLQLADLARWQGLAGLPLAGEISGSGVLAGRLPAPTLSGQVQAMAGRAGPLRWKGLELSARMVPEAGRLAFAAQAGGNGLGLDGRPEPVQAATLSLAGDLDSAAGRLRLGRAQVAVDGAALSAAGILDDWGRHSRLRLSGLVPDAAALGVPVKGRIRLQGHVSGNLQTADLGGWLAFRAPGLATGTPALDERLGAAPRGRAAFRSRGGRVHILDARAEGPGLRLRAAGAAGGRLDLWGLLSLPGLADGAVHLGGPAADPRAFGLLRAERPGMTGAVAFDLSRLAGGATGPLTLEAKAAEVPLQGQARLVDGKRLDGLLLSAPGAQVAGAVELAEGGLRGRLTGSVADLAEWRELAGMPLVGRLDVEADLDPAAGQSVRLEVRGGQVGVAGAAVESLSLRARAVNLTAEAREVTIEDLRLTRAGAGADVALQQPARLRLKAGETVLDPAVLSLGGGRLYLGGRMAGESVAAQARLEAVPLELTKLASPDLDLAGRLDGEVALSGTLADPRVEARLNGSEIGFAGSPRVAVRLDGQWQGGTVQATVSARDGERMQAEAGGTATLPDGPVSATFRAVGDMGRLSELLPFPTHVLTGKLDAQGRVDGTLAAPDLTGTATLAQGRYENLETGTLVTDLTLDARMAGGRVTVSAQGRDGGNGSVQLAGEGALPGAYRAEITLARFTALRRDDVEAQLDGTLTLEGEDGQGRIAGRLAVPRAEIDIARLKGGGPVTLEVVEINKPGAPPTPTPPRRAAAPPPQAPVAMALAVEVSVGHAFVRGRGLDSEWQGDVNAGGTLAQPSLTGQLKVARGTFDFLSKQFTLAPSSTVTFQGGDSIDPSLAVTAETNATDITAQVQITGTASQPSFAMTSSPTLPQDEILARVLFGRELGKLSTFQQIQLAQMAATGLTGKGGGFDPIGDVRSRLGLDVLGVGSAENGEGGPTLSAGKYLGPDTFLKVDQGTAGLGKVTVEQTLGGGFSVESSVGAQGSGGVGLNWRKDY